MILSMKRKRTQFVLSDAERLEIEQLKAHYGLKSMAHTVRFVVHQAYKKIKPDGKK